MAEYIKREDVIEKLTGIFKLQSETAKAIVDEIPSRRCATCGRRTKHVPCDYKSVL